MGFTKVIKSLIFILSVIVIIQPQVILTLPFIKILPEFSYETISNSTSINLSEDAPLNSVLTQVKATTYEDAMPIVYLIANNSFYFKIDSSTGDLTLNNPIRDKLEGSYTLTIVARDSAPIPDQQSTYLNIRINIIKSRIFPPEFNENIAHYTTVADFVPPGYMLYNNIFVTDNNFGKYGSPLVYCDSQNEQNIDTIISCEYFAVKCRSTDKKDTYQCYVNLIKPLDYKLKRTYIMSLKAQIGEKHSVIFSSSMNLIIQVTNSAIQSPRFTNSTYTIVLGSNSAETDLEVTVININALQQNAQITFILNDPKNLFKIDQNTHKCASTQCSQLIRFSEPYNLVTTYSMKVSFSLQTSNLIQTASATIHVVIQRPLIATVAPKFSQSSYKFLISEKLEPGSLSRAATITVYESEELSVYSSGFSIELLSPDLKASDGAFEILPTYGVGTLMASIKLSKLNVLDYERGKTQFNYVIKATSRSSKNLIRYANLTLLVSDHNEHAPVFERDLYTIVVNNPENYQTGDVLAKVTAYDSDASSGDIYYSIVGMSQDKFYVDYQGNIRLRSIFVLEQDMLFVYNLTISARDKGGLENFTNVAIFLNVMSIVKLNQPYPFECLINGARSELDLKDRKTLNPPLFITATSVYSLKHFLLQSVPSLQELTINQSTGEVYLSSPLPAQLPEFDRITLTVQAFQLQPLNKNLFLSSIICTATIYLQEFKNTGGGHRPPYFLSQYSATVDRESVNKNVPLIKIDAISIVPNSVMPIGFRILNNEFSDLFNIDMIQGFIYPRHNLGLSPKTYVIKVEANDPANGQYSQTDVYIKVIFKTGNKLRCNTTFLNLRIDPLTIRSELNNPAFLAQISCTSTSLFNDTPILYDILPLATFDCTGNRVKYTPRVGIDSSRGKIVSFEELNTQKFCDASFKIIATKDDCTVTIPFKLYLIKTKQQNRLPIFENYNSNFSVVPYYSFIGSYITSIVSFDPVNLKLIENYEIVSQPLNLNTNKSYFSIDRLNGIIRLNSLFENNLNYPLVKEVLLQISATTNEGLMSVYHLTINLSQILSNYYASFTFDPNIPDLMILNEINIFKNPVLKVSLACMRLYQSFERTYCGDTEFSLDYFKKDKTINATSYMIDSESRSIYASSSPSFSRIQSEKNLLILNSSRSSDTPNLPRYLQFVQKNLTIFIESFQSAYPVFIQSLYKVYLLDTTQPHTCILSIPFQYNGNFANFQIEFEQASNLQIENHFYLQYSLNTKMVYVYLKYLPYPYDKPKIEFKIRFKVHGVSVEDALSTKVLLEILKSQQSDNHFKFKIPETPNKFIVVHLNNNFRFNQIIYAFETVNTRSNSQISYKLLNTDLYMFQFEKNLLRIIYPFSSLDDFKRDSYLLFVEARDLSDPSVEPIYTTIQLDINQFYPSFNRKPGSGPLTIVVDEQTPIRQPLYMLDSLIINPKNQNIFFIVYDNNFPFNQSDTFYVNTNTNALELKKMVNGRFKDFYSIYIFVTYTAPIGYSFELPPSNLNESLLFIDVKVYSAFKDLNFIEYSKYMFVEEHVSVDKEIGFVRANSSIKKIFYRFESCSWSVEPGITSTHICNLFKLDETIGLITTNYSYYGYLLGEYFTLKILASTDTTEILLDNLKVFIVRRGEKSRFVFEQKPTAALSNRQNVIIPRVFQMLSQFLNKLKNELNEALKTQYGDIYYFEYCDFAVPFMSMVSYKLDACFYIIENGIKVLNFESTQNLINSINGIDSIQDNYSIKTIERCNDRTDHESDFRDLNIVFIVLVSLGILFAIIAIVLLVVCWISHMRHALLAPISEFDVIDDDSINGLLDS